MFKKLYREVVCVDLVRSNSYDVTGGNPAHYDVVGDDVVGVCRPQLGYDGGDLQRLADNSNAPRIQGYQGWFEKLKCK